LAADAPRAVGAVDDARPGRWGEKVIQFVVKPKRLSLMEYLYYAGDDRFGALGISTSPSTYNPQAASPLPRLDDAQQLSEVAAKIEASEPISELEAKIIRAGGSLGGAKPKALIEIGDEQWVIKFFNGESVDTPLSVSKCDIVSLAKRIDDELLTQRIGFDQARFQSGPAKRKRSSPFRRA
jgi:serine/threonine-protein kinase HipA